MTGADCDSILDEIERREKSSGWYIIARRRYCTLISLSVAAVHNGKLRISRESFLLCPIFLGS